MKKNILITSVFLLNTIVLFADANAGIEQIVHSGEPVQLSGSGSTLERNGKFTKFNWKQTEGNPYVKLSNIRSVQTTFIAPIVTESTVLTFKFTIKERFKNRKNRKRTFRSRDFVDVIVLPKDEGMTSTPDMNTENNPEVIEFKGFNYLAVTSPETGRVWLDRNLGAKRACLSPKDILCFGDLYQWGRETDGHQKRNSLVSREGAINIKSFNSNFVTSTEDGSYFYVGDWAFGDSNGSIRDARWSNINEKSICPKNYRVPSIKELLSELDKKTNKISFLNLPHAGFRNDYFGNLVDTDTIYLWSKTTRFESNFSSALSISSLKYGRTGEESFTPRSKGYPIRCIKD